MIGAAPLEAALYDTWTPDESATIGGWTAYYTAGYTRRVNCVTASGQPQTDPDVRSAISSWFTGRGIPLMVRVTPLLDSATASTVEREWGFVSVDRTVAMSKRVVPADVDPDILRVAADRNDFLDDLARLNGRSAETAEVRQRMMRRINDRAIGLWMPGVAVGLAVQSGSLVAVYSVAVGPAARGQGLARAMMQEAETWAAERSASAVFLQVLGSNQPAVRLYESLGYTQEYAYSYLEPREDGA